MKKKNVIIFLMVLTGISLMGTEKIVDFRIDNVSSNIRDIYLVDEYGEEDYGYYNLTKETTYQGYNAMSNTHHYLNTYTLDDQTEEPFKGVITPREMTNMVKTHATYNMMKWVTIPTSIVGFGALPAGIGILAYLGYMMESEAGGDTSSSNPLVSTRADLFFYASETGNAGLLFGGMVCTVLGAVGVVAFIVTLAITLYNKGSYNKQRVRLLKKLNKTLTQGMEFDNKIRVGFNLGFSQ